jgi:hypothetical protein
MRQVFPDYSHLVKVYGIREHPRAERVRLGTYLLGLLWVTPGVRPHTPNAYLRTVKGSLIHASQKRIRKCAGVWEHALDTTYPSEFVEWFPKRDTAVVGNVAEDLYQR